MIGALQRPVHRDEAAFTRHPPGEAADRLGRDLADARGPVGIFCNAVVAADQIIAEALEAYAVAREEFRIVQFLDDQRVREREHDRGVAMRARREPLGIEERGRIVTHRTDVAKLHARNFHAPEPFARAMLDRAAGRDLRVANRQPAEHHDQLGVLRDTLPTGARPVDGVHRA